MARYFFLPTAAALLVVLIIGAPYIMVGCSGKRHARIETLTATQVQQIYVEHMLMKMDGSVSLRSDSQLYEKLREESKEFFPDGVGYCRVYRELEPNPSLNLVVIMEMSCYKYMRKKN